MFDFKSKHILVIGDLMLDQYINGKVSRISPEAPVPILEQSKNYAKLGGAANVAANLTSLGAKATLVGVVGDDIEHQKMSHLITESKIESQLIVDHKRPTTLKTRLLADNQQILRVDKEDISDISNDVADTLLSKVEHLLSSGQIDFVILQDYNKGVFTPYLIPQILQLCRKNNIGVGVDPKVNNIDFFKGATFLKPNLKEALAMLNINSETFLNDTKTYAKQLLDWLDLDEIWITLSERGVCGINKQNQYVEQPTSISEVVDVCGAGDAVICIISLLHCLGYNLESKAQATNLVGGIVCSQPGVVTVQQSQFEQEWKSLN